MLHKLPSYMPVLRFPSSYYKLLFVLFQEIALNTGDRFSASNTSVAKVTMPAPELFLIPSDEELNTLNAAQLMAMYWKWVKQNN